MDDQMSAAPGHILWPRELAKLYRRFAGVWAEQRPPAIKLLDDGSRHDRGVPVDAMMGVSDVRTAFYRKLLERGQPLL